MPLTRYEIRNEYSLANPDLYRAAAKDDPEGLLEGVAMAGLVGIVRQLGDLAEFAAEVFHDLHEEVLATAARSHELLIRVQQLEVELPFVEKLMLAENNYVNFAYNPGLEWHANIQNDQNHFTQGDLPRFIRNAYEDCRGPPRLFLLDKFDVAGAGACLKRYTDPSFFRTEWASSELMKAEKEQQDKKARRIKKKGRRHRNGELREAFFTPHMQPRIRPASLEVENTASTSIHSRFSNSQHSPEQDGLNSGLQGPEQKLQPSRLLVPTQVGPNLKDGVDVLPQDLELKEASMGATVEVLAQDLEFSKASREASADRLPQDPELREASMEVSVDARPGNVEFSKASMDSSASSPLQEHKLNEVHMTPNDPIPVPSEFDSDKAEASVEVQKKVLPMGMRVSEDVTDFASETDNYMDALTTIDSEVETDSDVKAAININGESTSNHRDEKGTLHTEQVASDNLEDRGEMEFGAKNGLVIGLDSPEKSESSEKTEPAEVSSPDTNFAEERKPIFMDDNLASHKSGASTPESGSTTSMPPLEKSTVKSVQLLDSESAEGIPETPETPEANEYESLQLETLTSAFARLPEPVILFDNRSQTMFPEQLGSLSSHLGGKTMVPPMRESSAVHGKEDSFGETESEGSEGMKESSPHSSANSSIQPMKWANELSRLPNIVLDSDDELDGMQVSSSSSSSSSSVLSSPRPSTLATTFFDNRPQSLLSPIKSSPESHSGVSSELAGNTAPPPVTLMEAGASSSLMSPHNVQIVSPRHSLSQQSSNDLLLESKSSLRTFPGGDLIGPAEDQSLLAEQSEHFPPPPPLPPLEWRMTRKFGGTRSSFTKASEPSTRPPISQTSLWRLHKSFEAASLPLVSQGIHTQDDEFIHSSQTPVWHGGFQEFTVQSDGLEQLQNEEISEQLQNEEISTFKTDPMTVEASSEAHVSFKPELSSISPRSNELVQPNIPIAIGNFVGQEAPVIPSETFTSGHSRSPNISHFQTNDSDSLKSSSTELCLDDKEQDSTVPVIQEEDRVLDCTNASSKSPESDMPGSVPHKTPTDKDSVMSSSKDKTIPAPPMLDQLSSDSRPLPSRFESDRLVRSSNAPKNERKDALISAIASHDRSMLRKVPDWSQSSRTSRTDDREVLFAQIRTGSFSLRRTKIEKQETPRPVTNINVAAILEKANAIRQAFAGSDDEDEDDDWSDD